MTSTRRSLFVIGCLMAAFVVFAADSAFAQASQTEDFEADARAHDTIRLTWENPGTNVDKFSLRYQEGACAADPCVVGDFDTTMNIMRMDVAKGSSDEYEISIGRVEAGHRLQVRDHRACHHRSRFRRGLCRRDDRCGRHAG